MDVFLPNFPLTPIRSQVLLIVQKHGLLKAYDILEILKRDFPSARPMTVYRALDFLLDHCLIHKLHRLSSYVACRARRACSCYFLVCNDCHRVEEFSSFSIDHSIDGLSLKKNFKIKIKSFEIQGICSRCQSI